MKETVRLNGRDLSVEDVVSVARGFARAEIAPEVLPRMEASRDVIEAAAASDRAVYGINTGFGKLASVKIPQDRLRALQANLIHSHASGLGAPLPIDIVRALMVLRANSLVKETSGVRPLIPKRLAEMLNAGIHPIVPEQGSVGASGDLAPLSHVARGLLGHGEVRVVKAPEQVSELKTAGEALAAAGLAPVELEAKEGLALINGTQAQTAILALVVHESLKLWRSAHAAAALSLEALKGSPDAFEPRLHQARPHPGQLESAALLTQLLQNSQLRESHRTDDPRVQDPYCLRCTPQILGPVKETLDHAHNVAMIEINSATDNPLVLDGDVVSGGNFHGQPVAMALDYVAIALTVLAGISERRLERVLNPDLSPGLPAFLASDPGVESGFMMIQIAAASIVGESRTLCTPASIQSIPTDANQEDVVPMSMAAAFKTRRVLDNARRVVACELLCSAQGLEFHRPLMSSPQVEHIHAKVRSWVAPLTGDRSLTNDVEAIAEKLIQESLV